MIQEVFFPVAPIVELRSVSRQFGRKTALDDVSLSISRGGVFGLIGENGAGKTTLLKHLLGLYKPQKGSVRLFGQDPVRNPVGVLSRIGYLSEDRDLPNWMRIDELLNYTRAFYPAWDDLYAEHLRDAFDLDPRAKVKNLSRGQRARAGLLIALAYRPELLILDEPSSGLDPVVRRDILSAIIRTIVDEGRTVLFSSHLLDEVERVADHVAMLHQGRLVMASSLEALRENHHRLTLRFSESHIRPPYLAGAMSCSGAGNEWTYHCEGERELLRHAARVLGAEIVEEAFLTLDEIFVSRVHPRTGVQREIGETPSSMSLGGKPSLTNW